VEYRKGEEPVIADALSRLYEEERKKLEEEEDMKNEQGEETRKKDWDKHMSEV
jgi:hypothetical protein